MKKNIHYIVIPELPEEHQKPFINWITGQTMPLIEAEGENKTKCAYKADYEHWLEYYQKGQTAPIYD